MKIGFWSGLFVFPTQKHTPQIARSAKIRTEPKKRRKTQKYYRDGHWAWGKCNSNSIGHGDAAMDLDLIQLRSVDP